MSFAELKNLREFIVAHFSFSDLKLFCSDYYRDVFESWGDSEISKDIFAFRLVEYCDKHGVLLSLYADLQKERPIPFAERFPEISIKPKPLTLEQSKSGWYISYSPDGEEAAQLFASELQRRGIETHILPNNKLPVETWDEAQQRGLDRSRRFLVVLTPNAAESRRMRQEVEAALKLERSGKLKIDLFQPPNVESSDPSRISPGLANREPYKNENLLLVEPELSIEANSGQFVKNENVGGRFNPAKKDKDSRKTNWIATLVLTMIGTAVAALLVNNFRLGLNQISPEKATQTSIPTQPTKKTATTMATPQVTFVSSTSTAITEPTETAQPESTPTIFVSPTSEPPTQAPTRISTRSSTRTPRPVTREPASTATSPPPPTQQPIPSATQFVLPGTALNGCVVTTKFGARLQSKPSMQGAVTLAELPSDQTHDSTKRSDEFPTWFYIVNSGQGGWVSSQFLTVSANCIGAVSGSDGNSKIVSGCVVITKFGAKLQSKPSMQGAVTLTELPSDQAYESTKRSDEFPIWFYVVNSGQAGWVSSQFLQVNSACTG